MQRFHATIAAESKRSFYFLFSQPRKGGFDLFVKKTITVSDLHFSQLKSINVSNVCKVKSFSSIFMRMAGD